MEYTLDFGTIIALKGTFPFSGNHVTTNFFCHYLMTTSYVEYAYLQWLCMNLSAAHCLSYTGEPILQQIWPLLTHYLQGCRNEVLTCFCAILKGKLVCISLYMYSTFIQLSIAIKFKLIRWSVDIDRSPIVFVRIFFLIYLFILYFYFLHIFVNRITQDQFTGSQFPSILAQS